MDMLIVGLTIFQLFYFLVWGSFGVLLSYAVQQVKHANKIKTRGGFSLSYFISDNLWRGVLTTGAMILGVVFTKQFTGLEISEWSAFLAGFATDKVIDMLVNKKKK